MRLYLLLLGTAALGVSVPLSAAASGPHHARPDCEAGYTYVEEIQYKEVVKKICRPVPSVRKKTKWVYDCKTVDFCLPKCSGLLHGCKSDGEHGPHCDKPMTKNLLIKRLVVEECPDVKCEIETVVHLVPCVVRRKVPCRAAAAHGAPPVPAAPPGAGNAPPLPRTDRPAVGAESPVSTAPTAEQGIIPPPVPIPRGEGNRQQ